MQVATPVSRKLFDILIVEDKAHHAYALQRLLERSDYHVFHANTGREALEFLERQGADLVIADADLPVMNGHELSVAIKTHPQWSSIPVLLLTPPSSPEGLMKILEARADFFVTKPYHPRSLLERVQMLLAQPSASTTSASADSVIEFTLNEKKHVVRMLPRQLLTLLMATQEDAQRHNHDLLQAQAELSRRNEQLRRQSEHLKSSEKNFRALLEHNVDGIVLVDRNRRIRFVNTAGEVLMRRPAAKLLSTPFEFPIVPDQPCEIHINVPGWEPSTVELRVVDTIWENEPAYLAVLRDITQKKRDETRILEQQRKLEERNRELREQSQHLESSQKNFRSVLEHSADGIVIADPEGRICFVNTAGQLLLRQPESQLLGQVFAYALVPDQIQEVQINAPDWEPMVAELRVADALWEGKPSYLATLRDITQRKRDEHKIKEQQEALREANAQLQLLASVDGLTGLKNYRLFKERMADEFERATRYHLPLSLFLLDVDHFKSFNDSFGHPAGDELLKRIAGVLQTTVRKTDLAARYGGEEFVLIAPNTDHVEAKSLAERVCKAIAQGPWDKRTVTASFGVATLTLDFGSADELIEAADRALYHSKQTGRNRVTHALDLETKASPH